jgi:hypothetical protein
MHVKKQPNRHVPRVFLKRRVRSCGIEYFNKNIDAFQRPKRHLQAIRKRNQLARGWPEQTSSFLRHSPFPTNPRQNEDMFLRLGFIKPQHPRNKP